MIKGPAARRYTTPRGTAVNRVRGVLRQALTTNGGPMRVIEMARALEAAGLDYADYQAAVDGYIRGWTELVRVDYGKYRLRHPNEVAPNKAAYWQPIEVVAVPPTLPLADFLAEKMRTLGRAVTVRELCDLAVRHDYMTVNLYQAISSTMVRDRRFARISPGIYRLSPSSPQSMTDHTPDR